MKRKSALATSLVLLALTAVAYLPSLHNPFVFDDWQTIETNPSIRELGNLRYVLIGSRRPLVNLSYALDYAGSGLDPFDYHVTSVLLHALNVLLLYALAKGLASDAAARAGRPRGAAEIHAVGMGAAIWFAVHPLMTESVGYVSARAGVLCLTFILASVWCVRRGFATGRRRWLAAALGAYALGVACKESAVMLPFVFFAYDWLLAPGEAPDRARRRKLFHGPLLGFTALAVVVRVISYLRLEGGLSIRSAWQHQLTQLGVLWRYVGLLLVPIQQSVVHEVTPVRSPWVVLPWLSLAGLLALTAKLVAERRGRPLLLFGWIWFLLFLIPSSAVPLIEHMSEHRIYESSVGLFLVAGFACAALGRVLLERLHVRRRAWVALGLAGLLATGLTAATRSRLSLWASPITLWSDAAAKAPTVWAPHYALADAYRREGDCVHAIPAYRDALAILDAEPRAHQNLAVCLAQEGRFDEAYDQFTAAQRLSPDSAPLYNDLGVLEANRSRLDEARADFAKAIELDPSYVKPKVYLARLYLTVFRDPARAEELCAEVRRLAPRSPDAAACGRASR